MCYQYFIFEFSILYDISNQHELNTYLISQIIPFLFLFGGGQRTVWHIEDWFYWSSTNQLSQGYSTSKYIICSLQMHFVACMSRERDSDVTVDELRKQLREKDLVLTDIRLEALSSAHQLESLKDTVIKMRVSKPVCLSHKLCERFTIKVLCCALMPALQVKGFATLKCTSIGLLSFEIVHFI